jgi:hypothetical protein
VGKLFRSFAFEIILEVPSEVTWGADKCSKQVLRVQSEKLMAVMFELRLVLSAREWQRQWGGL